MRFLVDHCVPREVCDFLTSQGHGAWTAADAHLHAQPDDHLRVYAQSQQALVVTTNRDCAQTARRLRIAAVWLAVVEAIAIDAMAEGLAWLEVNDLPDGMVLRVLKTRPPRVLSPLPW